MKDKALRALLTTAAAFLVLDHFAGWLGGIWDIQIAVIGVAMTATVLMACAYMARAGVGSFAWFVVPALLLSIPDVAADLAGGFAEREDLLGRLWECAAPFVGNLAPLVLILVALAGLRRRQSPATTTQGGEPGLRP